MTAQMSSRRASIASTATTATSSSQSSTESFLSLVKSTLETAATVRKVNGSVKKSAVAASQAASDRLCTEIVSMMFQCSECLIRPTSTQRKGWSPATQTKQARATKSVTKLLPNHDLSASLLTYINNQLTTAHRQNVKLNALTIVTNDLSLRQLRRLSTIGAHNQPGTRAVRISSTAIGEWELRIGPTFKIHLVHSQLRRLATRLKRNLAITLERVSRQIVVEGRKGGDASVRDLTDLYLLRAYFGTQLWLHEVQERHQRGLSGKGLGMARRKAWWEVAALSFVEPYIAACPEAKAAAVLGRRVVAEMGMGGGGDEECELALVNEVLLQVVAP